MARAKLKADLNFFHELADEYGRIVEEFPIFIETAVESQLKVAEEAVKRNWTSMVPHGKSGDFVYDSIGLNVSRGRNGQDVVGSVGVFHIDRIYSQHGRTGKTEEKNADVNAPQLAWWTEFGTYGHAGTPFLYNAFYATLNEQEKAFKETFEQLVQRTMK